MTVSRIKKAAVGLAIAIATSAPLAAATPGVAHADTTVNDIKIGNHSQFVQGGGTAITGRPQTRAFKIGSYHISNS